MDIKFLPSGDLESLTLFEAAERAGLPIDGSCGGNGLCGKCKVRLVNPQTPDTTESSALTQSELDGGWRLACRVRADSVAEAYIPERRAGVSRKKDLARLPQGFKPEPAVRKHRASVEKASLTDQPSDLERIKRAAGFKRHTADYRLLGGIHELLERSSEISAVVRGRTVIALEEGAAGEAYGIAFDLGTTTVVGILCELNGGAVDAAAVTNPQSVFGADVISRIQHSSQSAEHLCDMRRRITDCMNDIINELTARNGILPNDIYDIAVVGNTTMSHLFLGVDASALARSPFVPVFSAAVSVPADELQIQAHPAALVYLLPNIAGHVGSDITGVMLASGICGQNGATLIIDIGTNGEILLARDGEVAVCSTAAGPAFEGAAIHQGMRAAAGAIEGVEITGGGLSLTVIDGAKPIGICGSGLIDAIAQMLDAGLIDKTGRLTSRENALANGVPPALARRLYDDGSGGGFILYENGAERIALRQKDIREVQLAKGAIAAGVKILMDDMCVTRLDRVMLAGAFGSYIKKESALRIGLLPSVSLDKIAAIGNAAGTGACMALLSESARAQAEREAADVRHVELSVRGEFMDEHMLGMYFPEG